VCCTTACNTSCAACDATGACNDLAAGSTGMPSCAPYLCSGTQPVCPTSCTNDNNCGAGSYCAGAACVGANPNGTACTANDQCSSGFCVDGFCCNGACAGPCDRCDLSGLAGSCLPVPAGSLPSSPMCGAYLCDGTNPGCATSCTKDNNCVTGDYCAGSACVPKKAIGAMCAQPNECLQGFCADGYCCNAACNGPCDECATVPGSCSFVPPGGAGSPPCTPYLCPGTAAQCATTCTLDSDCAAGNFCNAGSCVPLLGNGAVCSRTQMCTSGNCVDYYCCDQLCSGSCQACNLMGTQGMCTLVKKEAPPPHPPSCAPYLCDGTGSSCAATCAVDQDCVSTATCVSGACIQKQPNGMPCTTVAQCLSGFCADGVCCTTPCTGPCEACNQSGMAGFCQSLPQGNGGKTSCAPYVCNGTNSSCPNSCGSNSDCASGDYCVFGQCTKQQPNGMPCAQAGDCQNGFCVGGICCESACAGACQVCNVTGSVGKCTPAAVGADPKGLCAMMMAGDAGCRAVCAASGLCTYPVAGALCGNGSCSGSMLMGSSTCNGNGGCVPQAGVVDCSPYNCQTGTTCPTSCSGDPDCVSGTCVGGTCGKHEKPGASCAADSDCESKLCVDSRCCLTACTGACQRCDLPPPTGGSPDGICRIPVGMDPDGDCPGEGVCHGACAPDRTCTYAGNERTCDTCKACDGVGKCNAFPKSGDDAACMTISCGALSNECRTFADLTMSRCVGIGLCASANDPAACTSFTNVADGTMCMSNTGMCQNGQCISVVDAGPPPSGGGGHGGCSLGERPPSTRWLLLLVLISLAARWSRRKSRTR
jgi:hypothetical protein